VFAAPFVKSAGPGVSDTESKSKSESESGRQDGSISDNTSGCHAPRTDTTGSMSDSTHIQSDCKSDENAEAVAVSMLSILLSDSRRVNAALVTRADSSDDNNTALIYAAKNRQASVVQVFLGDPRVDKALIDHGCEGGWTALMMVARNGHTHVVAILLAHDRVDKTSIDRSDAYGLTA
jgi:ankyrin repeat protein